MSIFGDKPESRKWWWLKPRYPYWDRKYENIIGTVLEFVWANQHGCCIKVVMNDGTEKTITYRHKRN